MIFMFPQLPSWDIEGSATEMRYWSLFVSAYSQNRQSEERKDRLLEDGWWNFLKF